MHAKKFHGEVSITMEIKKPVRTIKLHQKVFLFFCHVVSPVVDAFSVES
jgi:hypothetical protein